MYNQIVLDYCLLICLFSNEINTYKIYGEPDLHPKVLELITYKQIKKSDKPDLVYIQENHSFINYYIKNELTSDIKWLLISLDDNTHIEPLYKDIRFFAEESLLINNLIVLHNIKPDFASFYRQNFTLPVKAENIERFFNFEVDNLNTKINIINDKNDILIIKALSSTTPYIYIGDKIILEDINKCKMLLNMNFQVLQCNDINNNCVGYFCSQKYTKNLLVFIKNQSKILESFLFDNKKLNVPVTRI